MTASIRSFFLATGLCVLMASGCAAPAPGTTAPEASRDAAPQPARAMPSPAPAGAGVEPVQLPPAPPMSDPLPPERMPTAVTLDYSCRADADCAVKNVGNCCGMMPACVNKDSPTDPAAVQAECARSGMSSICGFVDIAACSCVASRCEPQSATGGVTR